jgi:exosome complex component RRP41
LEKHNEATVSVEYSAGNMPQDTRILNETRVSALIQSMVEGCVILSRYPRQSIFVKVDIERDDGAAICVALNACVLALLDAGIPMFLTPTCISLVKIDSDGDWLFDPLRSEEEDACAHCLVCYGQTNELLLSEMSGDLTSLELESALELAVSATTAVRGFMRTVIEKGISY